MEMEEVAKKNFNIYGNTQSVAVAETISSEIDKQEIYAGHRESFFFDNEVFDLQGSEQTEQFGGIGVQSVIKFSINPALAEAPAALLTTLNKRQLDFQSVRAEVMIMCFDQSINNILATHVYLLGNGEYDYSVTPPTIKSLYHALKRRRIKLVGKRHRRKLMIRNWFLFNDDGDRGKMFTLKRHGFLHYLMLSQFYRWSLGRLLALTNDESTIKIPSRQEFFSKLRTEFGTFRTLQLRMLQN